VQIGQSAGAEASVASASIRGRMGEIYGYTYPLDRIADAWQKQADGAGAKIVVTLR